VDDVPWISKTVSVEELPRVFHMRTVFCYPDRCWSISQSRL